MSCTRRDLDKNLVQKYGFETDGHSGHERQSLWLDGKKAAMFYLPNPHTRQGSIGDGLLARIADQCHVTIGYLKQMIACHIGRDTYYDHLRGRE
ncbi:MAG: hypothetical protein ACYC4R_05265 [Anaerolineae bacterium]